MPTVNVAGMTVLELRRFAKEKGIKLGAGLSKDGIVKKIEAALSAMPEEAQAFQEQPEPAQTAMADPFPIEDKAPEAAGEASPAASPEAAPVTAPAAAPEEAAPKAKPAPAAEQAPPAASPQADKPQFKAAWRNPRAEPQYSTKPAYQAPAYPVRPSWQARSAAPRSPSLMRQESVRPAQTVRPAGFTPRFGPAADDSAPTQESVRPFADRPAYRAPEPAPPRPYRPQEPAPYRQEPAPYRQDPVRGDTLRQDGNRLDGFRQDGYRPDGFRSDGFRQEGQPQEGFFDAARAPIRPRREPNFLSPELGTTNPAVPEMLAAGDCGDGEGLLEIHTDGYGFLRPENFLPGSKDIYVSMAQIRRFGLRTGDYVTGKTRPQREGDKYSALLYITKVNGQPPEELNGRPRFEELTAVYPRERIYLSRDQKELDLRLIDLIAPIGFGQRGLILAPPHSGKTTLLKSFCNAIHETHPDAHIMALLLDERPEDITDFKDGAPCELLAASFDQSPENQIRVAEMVTERAQRLAEQKRNVVVLVDSLTRLAHAYNTTFAQSGRTPPGMLNPAVVYKAKKLFGAARNLREGGSLTVIATLFTDTGSRMDDALVEEFKGTANMELYLEKELADKHVYPPVNLQKSGTRREDLLLTPQQAEGLRSLRGVMGSSSNKDALIQLMDMLGKTLSNDDFLSRIKDWIALWEKSGFILKK